MIQNMIRMHRASLIVSCALLIVFAVPAFGAIYLTEGFEGSWTQNSPPGWTYNNVSAYWLRDNGTGSSGGWYGYPSYPGAPKSGSWCAFFNAYNFSSGSTATMISPLFSMSGSPQGRVTFWFYRGSGYTSSLEVQASSDGGTTWTTLGTWNYSTTGWQQMMVQVPVAMRTSTVKIGFKATADWWCDFFVDDVVVDDGFVPITYCPVTCQYAYYMGITNVTFGSINNTSCYACNNNYTDYTAMSTNVNQGITYPISVTGQGYDQYAMAWVDWNQNGSFTDPGESYTVGYTYYSAATVNITVPFSAAPGPTRMRVRTEYYYYGYPPPCGTVQYGEAEDYTVNVISASAPKIDLMPTTMTFTAEYGAPIPPAQNLTINNIGANQAMPWTATTSAAPAPNWLNVGPPASGTVPGYNQPMTTPVQPNRTNLPATMPMTTYTGTVSVASAVANNSPQSMTVTYNIIPAPKIDIKTMNLIMKLLYKKPVTYKRIIVYNSGGSFGGGTMKWTVTSNTSWITFQGATTGNAGQGFDMIVNPGLNTPGTYNGSITITAYNTATGTIAENSPLTIPVTMEIEPNADFTQTKTIDVLGMYPFNNSFGHRVLDVQLVSGTLGTFTAYMFPGQVPPGLTRLRYVHRYYSFMTNRSIFNCTLTLYYTLSEQFMGGVTKPELLTVYRQTLPGGGWTNMGGTSDPLSGSVTVANITNLVGNWICASPWYPKHIRLDELSATRTADHSVEVAWSTPLQMNAEGFTVQRAPINSDEWITVGTIPNATDGNYSLEDNNIPSGHYRYQVLGLDAEGNPLESQIVTVDVGTIPAAFTLGQNYPNPAAPTTAIDFTLPENGFASLVLYDLSGKAVRTLVDAKELAAGKHTATIDLSHLDGGTYIYRLFWNGMVRSRMLTVLK